MNARAGNWDRHLEGSLARLWNAMSIERNVRALRMQCDGNLKMRVQVIRMELRMPLVRQPEQTCEGNVHANEKSSSKAYMSTRAGQLAGNRSAIEQGTERVIYNAILMHVGDVGEGHV